MFIIYVIFKIAINLLFISLLVLIFTSLDKFLQFMDKKVLKNVSESAKYTLYVLFSILFEMSFVLLISSQSSLSFIDAFFFSSLMVACIAWFLEYTRSINNKKAINNSLNFNMAISEERSFQLTPFLLGSIIFCVFGFSLSIITYYPYFFS